MVDGRNAAALVVALVDLVRAGEADLVDVDTEDLRELESELAAVLRERLEPGSSSLKLVT